MAEICFLRDKDRDRSDLNVSEGVGMVQASDDGDADAFGTRTVCLGTLVQTHLLLGTPQDPPGKARGCGQPYPQYRTPQLDKWQKMDEFLGQFQLI